MATISMRPSMRASWQGEVILLGAQRRIHLEIRVVIVCLDVIFVEEEVVGRYLAGDGNTLGLCTSDHVDSARRGEMLDVDVATREARKLDIAHDLRFLACGRQPARPGVSRRHPR